MRLLFCLPACLSACLLVCLSVCLSVSPSLGAFSNIARGHVFSVARGPRFLESALPPAGACSLFCANSVSTANVARQCNPNTALPPQSLQSRLALVYLILDFPSSIEYLDQFRCPISWSSSSCDWGTAVFLFVVATVRVCRFFVRVCVWGAKGHGWWASTIRAWCYGIVNCPFSRWRPSMFTCHAMVVPTGSFIHQAGLGQSLAMMVTAFVAFANGLLHCHPCLGTGLVQLNASDPCLIPCHRRGVLGFCASILSPLLSDQNSLGPLG